VFLASAAGADILLLTPPGASASLVEYRMLGGVLDFYFFSGPSPQAVVEQYASVVGTPAWMPLWGFGFHLCRWGYNGTAQTRETVDMMRAADIPLESKSGELSG
jgi:alpha-glucosidase